VTEDELIRFRREHLGRLLREIDRDFSTRVKMALAARRHPGIKPAHTQVFASLPLDGARLTELADRAGITKQSMGALVNELESLGYLKRSPDPDDGRAIRIGFSKKGRRLLEDAVTATATVEARYGAAIGDERVKAMKRALADLVEALGIEIPA